MYDVEEGQVRRALENIRAEVLEFEKEGILRGTLTAAHQGRHFYHITISECNISCMAYLLLSYKREDETKVVVLDLICFV